MPRARGPLLGAVLAAMGLSIAERYRQSPAPVTAPEPQEAPEIAQIVEVPEPPSARRRVLLVTLPVVVAMAAAVGFAGMAYSALGTMTTVAGTGTASSNGDGGLATAATINSPRSVAIGPDGDIYIAEGGSNKIRRVDKATGLISVFAGTGSSGSTGDGGPATSATFNGLQAVDVASDGTVYAVETSGGRVRKIAPNGTISTLVGTAGSGYSGDGGPASAAKLLAPYGVAVAADGSVLIADFGNSAIRKVNTSGVISTVAGTGTGGYSGNGGQATSAQIKNPTAVEPTPDGGFYIAEQGNNRVRYVNASGTISLLAGTGTAGFAGDGGAATSAQISAPTGLAIGTTGSIYISDTGNNRIRAVDTSGNISTLAGSGGNTSNGDGGPAASAGIVSPRNIAVTSAGLYIAEASGHKIRLVEGYGVAAPTVSAVSPTGPANDNAPKVTGTAAAGASVKLYSNATCTSAVIGTGTAAEFAGSGIAATVANDSTTTIYATATDAFGGVSPCSTTSVSYTEDSTAPATPTITGGPSGATSNATPSWTFTTSGGTIQCRLLAGATEIATWSACTTSYSPDLTARTDGPFTFEVRAIDAAQNAGTASRTITLDRSAPAAPVLTADPGATTNDITPTWAWTAEASAAVTCRIDKGATEIADWGACASPKTYDLSGKGDGAYTFSVRATDAALNPGAIRTFTMTLDTVAPAAPAITGTPGADANDTTPTWTFGDVSGATIECQITRGATVVDGWSSCASTKTYDLSASDGTYTFAVRARDSAGNESATTSTYRLDTVTPATPTITGSPGTTGSAVSPSWSFTGDGTGTYECQVVIGAVDPAAWSTCASPYIASLGSGSDGTYTFYVRARDAAPNISGVATGATYTLDRDPPAEPVLTAEPGDATNDTTPTWEFTAAGTTGAQCRIDKGATQIADWGSCVSPKTYDLSGKGDGDYTFSVRGLDGASNLGAIKTDTFTLDTVAPTAPTFASTPGADTSDTTPSWSFGAVSGATLTCRLVKGATEIVAWSACATSFTHDLSASDGTYTLSVRATDAAGNTTTSSDTIRLDTAAPATPTITNNPPASGTGTSPGWSFTGDGTGTYECRVADGPSDPAGWTTCASPHIATLTADGTYTFTVRARDAAQNVSGIATGTTYELDRDPPAAPVLTVEPGDLINDTTPTWEFTAAGTTGTQCRIDKGATQIADWASCVSPKTYDLSGRGDGAYTFSVRGLDGASNLGAIKTDTFTLDTAAPGGPAFTATPGADTNDDTPSWSFGAVSGATLTCRLARGATEIVAWSACSATFTHDLSAEDDGTYTLSVRATDGAGNTTTSTDTIRLDTAAPAAPSIGTSPAAGNATSPSWSFTGEASATFQCSLAKGATTISGFAACTSPKSYALASETDGTFTFAVRAKDAAGNIGDETTRTYELDRVAPPAPAFTASPSAAGNGPSPSWSFSTPASTTVECRLARGSTLVSDWTTCTSPRSPDLSALVDGDYTLRLRARDAAGNLSGEIAGSYKLDRVAPVAPSITSAPVAVGAGTSPTWGFTGEASATLECRLATGSTVIADWATCTSPQGYDLSSEADALYTFSVRARDAAGNTGSAATGSYRLDREAPRIDAAPPAGGTSREPSWSFSAASAALLQCRLERGADLIEDWATCTSPKAWSLAGKPDGSYTFSVRALDAGNQPSAVVSGTYLLDTTAPGTPAFGEAPAGVGTGTSPRWSWAGDAGATFECRTERDGVADGAWAACASPRTLDLGGRTDARYTLAVRAVDAVGNRGTAATGAYILDRAAPPAPTYVTAPATSASTPSASWGFVSEPGAAYECQLERDGAVVEAFVPCASPRGYDLAPLPDGAYVITVRATDGAGNRSTSQSAPFVLDRAAPDGLKLLKTPGAIGNDRTPTWAFALEGAAAFECTLRFGTEDIISPGTCSGPQTYELQAGKDGRYVFRVRGFDAVGNAGAEVEDGYELDTAEPKAPEIAGEEARTSADPSPAWKFTAEAGALVECQLKRGDDVVARMDECASPKDYKLDLDDRGEGTYTFGVRATDAAGNVGELATATYEYERAQVKRKDDAPKASPLPPATSPPAANTAAPPAPAAAPAATTTSAEGSERREKAARARARKQAAAVAERRAAAAARRAAQAAPTARAPKAKAKHRKASKKAAEKLAEVGKVMAQAAGVAAEKTAFPVLLLGLCGLFLVAQDRVDRRDPKLALAPIFADPEMEFVPRSRLAADEEEQEPEP